MVLLKLWPVFFEILFSVCAALPPTQNGNRNETSNYGPQDLYEKLDSRAHSHAPKPRYSVPIDLAQGHVRPGAQSFSTENIGALSTGSRILYVFISTYSVMLTKCASYIEITIDNDQSIVLNVSKSVVIGVEVAAKLSEGTAWGKVKRQHGPPIQLKILEVIENVRPDGLAQGLYFALNQLWEHHPDSVRQLQRTYVNARAQLVYNIAYNALRLARPNQPEEEVRMAAFLTSTVLREIDRAYHSVIIVHESELEDAFERECPNSDPDGINTISCGECDGTDYVCKQPLKWEGCPCAEFVTPIYTHPVDQAIFDYNDVDGPGQKIWDLIDSRDDPPAACEYIGGKSELRRRDYGGDVPEDDSAPPGDYCQCGNLKYPAMWPAQNRSACDYATTKDLPMPLPEIRDTVIQENRYYLNLTQHILKHNFSQAWGEVRLQGTFPSQNLSSIVPEFRGGKNTYWKKTPGSSYNGKIQFASQPPAQDPSTDDAEIWKAGNWFNFTYMKLPNVEPEDPEHQDAVIAWSTNSADGKTPGMAFPGFGCDNLTDSRFGWDPPGPVSDSVQTRSFRCWFIPNTTSANVG